MENVIAGTPLRSIAWQSDLGKVRFVWRPGTEPEEKLAFLESIRNSLTEETGRAWLEIKNRTSSQPGT